MNCHPIGDFPRQTDDRHRHRMLVARGADDRGTPAMRCTTCHQSVNTADGRVPGAPHWHLAPRSMGWEGLSDGDLCRAVKDPKRNGGRSIEATVKHMTTDALVQWAWNPGPAVRAAALPVRLPPGGAAMGGVGRGLSAVVGAPLAA